MEPLSDRQRQMLTFISGYIAEHDRPPTNREIGQAMGIGSTGHVDYHLSVLAKKGFIEREANTSRGPAPDRRQRAPSPAPGVPRPRGGAHRRRGADRGHHRPQ